MERKVKADPVLKIIATMRLARELNCSYEEANKKIKAMFNECKHPTGVRV